MLRVIQTVAGTRKDHGGPSRSVTGLCDALYRNGCDLHFVTGSTRGYESIYPVEPVNTYLIEGSARLGRLIAGRQFYRQIDLLCKNAPGQCVIHDHGLWLPSNHATASVASRNGITRIVSPRGMVSSWALSNGSRVKRLAWKFFQESDLHLATAFHATSLLEAEELRSIGMKQPIAVIPNGISPPEMMPTRQRLNGRKRMLFLSRFHPKKGLLNLLSAWAQSGVSDTWELLLVGPDESGHRAEIQKEIVGLGLQSSVCVQEEINDEKKWQQFVDSDLFILPSFSENFGIVVAEAMAAGLPVITTVGTPWNCLESQGIGWWVQPSVPALTDAIQEACAMNNTKRQEMGRLAAHHATTSYTWIEVASQLVQFYNWLSDAKSRPPRFVLR
jgi:glycosyltransferase involved in cell wall biosynthesis